MPLLVNFSKNVTYRKWNFLEEEYLSSSHIFVLLLLSFSMNATESKCHKCIEGQVLYL